MKFWNNRKLLTIAVLLIIVSSLVFFTNKERQVDYSSDVKPIFNKKCISCHGGVKAKSGFSLLFREEALAKAESGKYPIVPGDPDASEMIRRITHNDPAERMPYKHEPLSEEEISILRRWIKQGAKWGDHWAYLPVAPQTVPDDDDKSWSYNDADKFILAKLNEQGLNPSPQADKATLLRRVSLDLIGMYPSEGVANKFLNSNDPDAYEELVDSLLAPPAFGEKWASMWLDLARYADSKGYESDLSRQIWKYRDWVIKSFNNDMPYDEFLRDQIAGDLLPDATEEQFIATAFHRNSMTNDEGGTSNEEFRVSAVIDRVNTTWEAVLGTTFSCVQCHSHPYDPFRHKEYYGFLAYFNNTRDEDQFPREYPYYRFHNQDQQQQINQVINWVNTEGGKDAAAATNLLLKTLQPAIYPSTADSLQNAFVNGNNAELTLHNNSFFMFKNMDLRNVNSLIFRYYLRNRKGINTLTARAGSPNGKVIGKAVMPSSDKHTMQELPLDEEGNIQDVYFTFSNPSLQGKEAKYVISLELITLSNGLPGNGKPGFAEIRDAYWKLLTEQPESTIPVMVESPDALKRKTFVFERGNRLTPGEEVSPGVPETFAAAMPANAPADRRGLAMWLTDKKNPLVSRTMVNRIWEQLFGMGIVETLEDMGTQGIPPTHKELLDHYAWKFMSDYNWSLKRLIKEFVMSATYKQDSRTNDELKEKDPGNRYYARGPRIRLHAEQLRDQHLCISGALSKKMYGEPVMPWQPAGIWSNPYNSEEWKNSEGEDRYRRSVYTFIKRSAAYPSMVTFDASARNACTPRRIRTNTPLQALVTLNDSAFVDMSARFAERMAKEGGTNPEAQISRGYEIMMYKKIDTAKMQSLLRLYNTALTEFRSNDTTAKLFTGRIDGDKVAEHAALKLVANAMMNLDEVITKN